MPDKFWETKAPHELSREEWESLCDGCGRCCLIKLEDEDDGTIYFTNLVCRYFDQQQCQCSIYPQRTEKVPDCVTLTPDNIDDLEWMPMSCAYRLYAAGRPLPEWHHLVSGERQTVIDAGVAICGHVMSEDQKEDDTPWEEHIIDGPI